MTANESIADTTRVATISMTLRLPEAIHEQLRRDAFDKRTTVTALIRDAIARVYSRPVASGCDQCGATPTSITTPGAIRLCADHGGMRSQEARS